MLKLLGKLIKYSITLFVVLLFGSVAFMFYDEGQLGEAINDVAQQVTNSGTPYVIPLPADRYTFVSYELQDSDTKCAEIITRNENVRLARINGIDRVGEIPFNSGIDLSNYADELAACNTASILLMAKGGYLKGSFELTYEGDRITGVTQPRVWD